MKLFTINGVYVKAFANWKWLRTQFCLTLAKLPLNNCPLKSTFSGSQCNMATSFKLNLYIQCCSFSIINNLQDGPSILGHVWKSFKVTEFLLVTHFSRQTALKVFLLAFALFPKSSMCKKKKNMCIPTFSILSPAKTSLSPCSSPLGTLCLHNKFGSHGVPNITLSNFACLLVDFGEVLCSSANELQQNSNASSREDHIPKILTVLLKILRVYIWPLWPSAFCLSFVNNI